MYSIFFSKIEKGIEGGLSELKKIIKFNSKVAIFPWAFPVEINSEKLLNDYFKKGDKRYNRYIDSLKKLEINVNNVTICDCYNQTNEELRGIIKNSDILLFPGGNPEMLFNNILHRTEIFYDLKYSDKIIIGESAGAVLQFRRYFVTKENNFYKYFAFYDGIGVINDDFYLDVHTRDEDSYKKVLKNVAKEYNKNVYAIYDEGCMIYDRKKNEIVFKKNVEVFE